MSIFAPPSLFYKSFEDDDLSLLLELSRLTYRLSQADLLTLSIPGIIQALNPQRVFIYNESGVVKVVDSVEEIVDYDGEISGINHDDLLSRKTLRTIRIDCLSSLRILELISTAEKNFTLEVLEFGALEDFVVPYRTTSWEGRVVTRMEMKVLTLSRPRSLLSKWDLIFSEAIKVSRLIKTLNLPSELELIVVECILGKEFGSDIQLVVGKLLDLKTVFDESLPFSAQRVIRSCYKS